MSTNNVKINLKNVERPLRFEDLKIGNYFTVDSSDNAYIKIDKMYTPGNRYTYYQNAIRLEDGNGYEFDDATTVIKLKGELNFERE